MKWFRQAGKKQQLTDEELLRLFLAEGKLTPLTELYNRYVHLIYGVCLKYLKHEQDSQDMCMQVFEKLPEAVRKQEIRNFGGWVHVLTKNECLMKLRSVAYRQERSNSAISETPNMELAYSLHYIAEEDKLENNIVALEKAILELPPEQQRCVRLFYLKQKCYKEVADITGYSLNQVKSYLQNGKRNLKKNLQYLNEEV